MSSLTTKWVFRTGGDVSATPTVGADAVYVPDWAGNLYAIRKDNGQAIWTTRISQYTGAAAAYSRVSPAVHGNDLIVGDIASSGTVHDGARIIAINQQNGALHWVTQVEKNPAAIITGSPVVVGRYGGGRHLFERRRSGGSAWIRVLYISRQHGGPRRQHREGPLADLHCAGQRRKVGGYSGGAIWQPPAIDTIKSLIYVGTGNNYTVPDSVESLPGESQHGHGSCRAWTRRTISTRYWRWIFAPAQSGGPSNCRDTMSGP